MQVLKHWKYNTSTTTQVKQGTKNEFNTRKNRRTKTQVLQHRYNKSKHHKYYNTGNATYVLQHKLLAQDFMDISKCTYF